jgi:hypothetical protein
MIGKDSPGLQSFRQTTPAAPSISAAIDPSVYKDYAQYLVKRISPTHRTAI